jgi:acyl-coenzyme A thioesterase PaaI-like protein
MQGGFITAAFDNVFGPLSYLAARGVCTSIDIHTQFVRGIGAGDTLTVTAIVVSRGTSTIYMTGEALNSAKKVVAIANTNLLIVSKKGASVDLTRTG